MSQSTKEGEQKTFIEEEVARLHEDLKKHRRDREKYLKILRDEENQRRTEREKGNSPREDYNIVEEDTYLELEATEYYINRDQERIGYLLSEGTIDELIEEEKKEVKWAEEALGDSTRDIAKTRQKINKEKEKEPQEDERKKRKSIRKEDTLEFKLEGYKVARDYWEEEVYKRRAKLRRLNNDKERRVTEIEENSKEIEKEK